MDAGSAYTDYVWSNGGTVQSILVNQPGTYWVRVTDADTCVGSDTVIVGAYTQPDIDLGPDINLCDGESTTLIAPSGNFAYLWNDGTTDQDLEVTASGTYWCEIRDGNNCTNTDTIVVTFHAFPPVEDLGPDLEACDGESVTIPGPAGYAFYTWSNGDTSQNLTVTTSGTYRVEVSNAFGCSTTSLPVGVTIHPLPDAPTISGGVSGLTASGSGTYAWYYEGTLIAGETGNSITPENAGNYTATVTDGNGCTSELSAAFEVIFDIVKEDIPQIFTPNGDGLHDFFNIPNLDGFPENNMTVMNRWGNEVYSMDGYTGDWNGNSKNGQALPTGTYYYILDLGNGQNPITGSVQITR
ncbi:MAG: gliding motility-associated C-terminal domain-containing protein [Bacteroidota bacterium]